MTAHRIIPNAASPTSRTAARARHAVRRLRCWLLMAALALPACARPDLAPFADATVDLHRAMTAAGEQIIKSAQPTAQPSRDISEHARATDHASAAQHTLLQQSWAARAAIMDLWIIYADMLALLTASDQPDHAAAAQLAAALDDLASLTRLSRLVGSAAPDTHPGLASLIVQMISAVQTARTLRAAITAADPLVAAFGALLHDDLQDLQHMLRIAQADQRATLDDHYAAHREHYHALLMQLQHSQQQHDAINAQLTDTTLSELQRSEARHALRQGREELAAIDQRLRERAAAQQQYAQAITHMEAQQNATIALVHATQAALDAWVLAHRDLASAMKHNRPLSTRLLTLRILQMHQAIEALRALDD